MEVHHHPQVEHKRWKGYLLEFLMIFLAVTLGFFAENIREHYSDKAKVREYMREIVANLRYDTTRCGANEGSNRLGAAGIDSLRLEIRKALGGRLNANALYYYRFTYGTMVGHAAFNTTAISELKSSGFLRLVGNKKITDELADYYERKLFATNFFLPDDKEVIRCANDVFSMTRLDDFIASFDTMLATTYSTSYDFSRLLRSDPPLTLRSTESKQLEDFYTAEANYEIGLKRYNFWLGICKKAATQLIADISRVYHL